MTTISLHSVTGASHAGTSHPVIITGLLTTLLMLTGCAAPIVPGYAPAYHEANLSGGDHVAAPEEALTVQEIDDRLTNFLGLFADLKQPDIASRVRETYGEPLYFNDTIHTITDLDTLADYLEETAERVDATTVRFDQVFKADDSYFLRWTMNMQFSVNNKDIDSTSIGMTQIKLDRNGRVIFHQDFWDSAEGLYRHLPVVGNVMSRVKARL